VEKRLPWLSNCHNPTMAIILQQTNPGRQITAAMNSLPLTFK
jgi:hypothetical protein